MALLPRRGYFRVCRVITNLSGYSHRIPPGILTENGVPPSGNTRAVVGQRVARRAPRWSGPSGVNNKQLCTMDIEAEYIGYIKS